MPETPSNIQAIPTDEGSALREMLKIALPAVVSMVSFSLMQFVDRLLTARLIGPEALAAAGNGGIASWVPASVMMGILGVINTYVSQNLGAGKPENGPKYAWAGMWMCLVVWCLVLIPYAVFFPQVFHAMRSTAGVPDVSNHVAAMETIYGRTLLLGLILTLSARSLGHYFYGMHRPWVVMISTLSGNAVNLVVSYALIKWAYLFPELGAEGMARMAMRGTAIGTVVGAAVECIIPLSLFLSSKYHRLYQTRSSWKPAWEPIRDLLKLGWPGGLMFGNEMVCWWIFMGGFVASFDEGSAVATHNPAGWIVHQYLMLSFMPAVGISIAATAMVGKCMGAGRADLAESRTWLAVKFTMTYMGLCALGFVLFGPTMARVFMPEGVPPAQADRIVYLARWMLVMAATFQLFDGMAITVSGALRGAGDTVWPGVATVLFSWGFIVGGGWIAVNYLPWMSSFGPWAAASLYIIALSIFFFWRFRSGRWKSMKVLGTSSSEASEGGQPVLAGDIGPAGVSMAPALDVPVLDGSPSMDPGDAAAR
ncbi:MAG: MATE family efflux transporter [Phycisphaerae bacterium]|nr:MATE family efflux transporter [Phycisphaerae bacterium]